MIAPSACGALLPRAQTKVALQCSIHRKQEPIGALPLRPRSIDMPHLHPVSKSFGLALHQCVQLLMVGGSIYRLEYKRCGEALIF